ncbi:MAG TPA: AraC family transcriptional regulator [Syntrophomonadaceae bacterium]|nr:AraC family transcriptional regulator [Syntrophomonadaceae bacterium]
MIKDIKFKRPTIKGVEIKRCSYSEQSYKEHVHEELSIGYIEKGSTAVDFNGKNYSFTEGDGIISPPYISHICRPIDLNYWQFVMLYINTSYYEGEFAVPRKLTDIELDKFKDFLGNLSGKNADFEVENALIDLLTTCTLIDEKNNGPRPDKVLENIYNFIKNNYLENIALESLEAIFSINKFSIIRGFKSIYNTTPSSFQLQLKVAHSKGLLARGMNILDVCSEAGFYDQAHFTREFKKANGKTPLQYQKDILG